MERVELDDGTWTTLDRWGSRGPVLLAIHGMTSSRRSWEALARRLEGRYRVIAYDQRGHGDSAANTGPMSLVRGVGDAANVVAYLDEPVDVLLGHSWGGAIAILGGERLPVARVAAVDPMIRQVGGDWYREYLDELRESFALTGEARDAKTREEYAAWPALDVEGKVHAVHAMTVAPIEGLWRENPPEGWDLRAAIARYEKPLFLALAAAGTSINDDATLAEVQRDRSPSAEVVTFERGGHNLHRTNFEEFARALDAWLDSSD
ncbi:MAG: alpha/beta hydrolase [Candidatus Baltobacteraceae bacterium]